jgi:hypothetical protein
LAECENCCKRINSKDNEIEKLEVKKRELNVKIDQLQSKLMQETLHSSRMDDSLLQVQQSQTTSQKTKEHSSPRETKRKTVLLVGSSQLQGVNAKGLSSEFDVEKIVAYTVDDTSRVLEANKEKHTNPDTIALHLITNEVKNHSCTETKIGVVSLVNDTKKNFPDAEIIVSLATPHFDNSAWADKCKAVNALIRDDLEKTMKISIYGHENFEYEGGTQKRHSPYKKGIVKSC